MKKLNEKILEIGDIILTTRKEPLRAAKSFAIRLATWSDISHVMIYVGEYSAIHANKEGVHAVNTDRLTFSDDSPVYVRRLKQYPSISDRTKICDYVRMKIAAQYSFSEAIKAWTKHDDSASSKQFCSRLIAQAFGEAGYPIVDNADYCTPDEIKNSNLLIDVENPTEDVSASHAEYLKNTIPLDQIMRDTTTNLMDVIQEKIPEIEHVSDIGHYVIQHPESDSFISSALMTSGYLTIGQDELEMNPYQYDHDLFGIVAENDDRILDYCKSVIKSHNNGDNRFTANRRILHEMWIKNNNLDTLFLLFMLYRLLCDLDEKRVEVVSAWLKNNEGKIDSLHE